MITLTQHHSFIFSIAYRMLGNVRDAEDMVQETYLRLQHVDLEEIENIRGYLTTVTTRLCLNYLHSAYVQREKYVGPWLPEPLVETHAPIVEPEKKIEKLDSISFAFLVLLEVLSPIERAVFLLREIFDYDYSEIAVLVEKEETNCRQIFSRAKRRIVENRPRYASNQEQHQHLLDSFLEACQTGDLAALNHLLAEDAIVTVDGGGKVEAATRPIAGREQIIRFFGALIARTTAPIRAEPIRVNGQRGILVLINEQPSSILLLATSSTHIHHIWTIRNPDKMTLLKME